MYATPRLVWPHLHNAPFLLTSLAALESHPGLRVFALLDVIVVISNTCRGATSRRVRHASFVDNLQRDGVVRAIRPRSKIRLGVFHLGTNRRVLLEWIVILEVAKRDGVWPKVMSFAVDPGDGCGLSETSARIGVCLDGDQDFRIERFGRISFHKCWISSPVRAATA